MNEEKEEKRLKANAQRRKCYHKNREAVTKRQREYYKKTGGKMWKAWYLKNKEKCFANVKSYRNTAKGKASVKEYNSKPEVKKRNKEWKNKHPHYNRDKYREGAWKRKQNGN